jgi:hypothetical protein
MRRPDARHWSAATFLVVATAMQIPVHAEAADPCLLRPAGAAPKGQHWYYRVDSVTGRKCWLLLARSEQAHSGRPSSPRSPIRSLPPAVADAKARDQRSPTEAVPELPAEAAIKPATKETTYDELLRSGLGSKLNRPIDSDAQTPGASRDSRIDAIPGNAEKKLARPQTRGMLLHIDWWALVLVSFGSTILLLALPDWAALFRRPVADDRAPFRLPTSERDTPRSSREEFDFQDTWERDKYGIPFGSMRPRPRPWLTKAYLRSLLRTNDRSQ